MIRCAEHHPGGEGKGNGLPHHLSGLVRNDNISSGLIIDESGSPKGDPDFLELAAVAALVVVLILILVLLVLVAVLILLILISVLVIHFGFLPSIHCGKTAFPVFPGFQDLSLGRNRRLAARPAVMAVVIPPAAAFSPPVKMPRKPSLSTASRTPLARVFPKPVRGTVAPAPAKSTNFGYSCKPPRTTPATT